MMNFEGYGSLRDVLDRAYAQAATGKGHERHAVCKPFDQQPMQELISLYGVGFALGQAAKKAQESQRLPAGRDVAELLGAINYLAGAVIALESNRQPVTGPKYLARRCKDCGWHMGEGHSDKCQWRGHDDPVNDNEQPRDCCPVCQHVDSYHHEKCTAAPGQFGVHDV